LRLKSVTIQYYTVETAIYASRVRKLKMPGNPKDYRAVYPQ